MPNAKGISIDTELIKVMSVGPSGEGKSVFASSFPTPGFVFDFGAEILSYRGKDFDYEQFELSPNGWKQFDKVLLQIKKCLSTNTRLDGSEGEYKSIVVDNLTAMTALAMEYAMQLDPKRSPTNGPLWNVHYGMVKNLMEGRIRQIFDLKANLVVIAHLDVMKDEAGTITGVQPLLTGQLSEIIPGYFQEVYYHTHRKEGGETKWFVQTIPMGYNHGRSRLSGKERVLPDTVENDYNILVDYIKGRRKKTTEKKG